MSHWYIPDHVFEPSLADKIRSAAVRKAQEEFHRSLRKAELEMGGPIEVVRTEWKDGVMTTWYRRAERDQ